MAKKQKKFIMNVWNGKTGHTDEHIGVLIINKRTWDAKIIKNLGKPSKVFTKKGFPDPYVYVSGIIYHLKEVILGIDNPLTKLEKCLTVENKDGNPLNIRPGNLRKLSKKKQTSKKQLSVTDIPPTPEIEHGPDTTILHLNLIDIDNQKAGPTRHQISIEVRDWERISPQLLDDRVYVDFGKKKPKKVWVLFPNREKWHLKYAVAGLPEQGRRVDSRAIVMKDGNEWNLTRDNIIDDRGDEGNRDVSIHQIPKVNPHVMSHAGFKQQAEIMSKESLREVICILYQELTNKSSEDELKSYTNHNISGLLGVNIQ